MNKPDREPDYIFNERIEFYWPELIEYVPPIILDPVGRLYNIKIKDDELYQDETIDYHRYFESIQQAYQEWKYKTKLENCLNESEDTL